MDCRRWALCLEILIAATVIGAHVAVIGLAPGLPRDGLAGMLIGAVPFCQLVLLLAWAVLGPGPAIWRVWSAPVLLVGGGVAWAWMWQSRWSGINRMEFPLLVLTGVVSIFLLVILRLGGQAIRSSPRDDQTAAQFSIRSLIGFTTLVAVVIAVLERLRPMFAAGLNGSQDYTYVILHSDLFPDLTLAHTVRQLVLAVSIAGISCATIWAILRPGSPWIRLLATAVTAAALGVYLSHLSSSAEAARFAVANQVAVLMAIVGGSVVPLRLMQFRLMRAATVAVPVRAPAKQRDTSLLAESTP